MIRRPPRSTQSRSSAASDVYKRQQWTSAERRIEPLFYQYFHGCILHIKPEIMVLKLFPDPVEEELGNQLDILGGQLLEDNDVVDAIQQLGTERPLELPGYILLHLFILERRLAGPVEAERRRLVYLLGTQVGRHDDYGVAEVHGVSPVS